MEDFVIQQLDGMKTLQDKPLLKDILGGLFLALESEVEGKYQALENRVWDEIPLRSSEFVIYSSVVVKNNYDSHHSYLNVMCPEDLENPPVTIQEILEYIDSEGSYPLCNVFYQADHKCQHKLGCSSPIFQGALVCGETQISFRAKLIPAKKYWQVVKQLYSNTLRNGVEWKTANMPYLDKIWELAIISLDYCKEDGIDLLVDDICIEFREYESSMLANVIPVWNIQMHLVTADDFPMPAIDKVNYEYQFDLTQIAPEDSYLVNFDSAPLVGVRREKNTLIAVAAEQLNLKWELYRFRQKAGNIAEKTLFPVFSNAVKDSCSERLSQQNAITSRTKAEIVRWVSSYEAYSGLHIKDIRLCDSSFIDEAYSMNPFIIDEIRDPAYQKNLLLIFESEEKADFLQRDRISFLVSQVQLRYPDFNCIGALA